MSRSVAARPGTCELTLYGLSAEQRSQILALPRRRPFGSAVQVVNAGTILEVSAGYVDAERPIIFRGNLRRAFQRRQLPETWLELSGGDGEYAIRSARVRRAFAPTPRCGTCLGDRRGDGGRRRQRRRRLREGVPRRRGRPLLRRTRRARLRGRRVDLGVPVGTWSGRSKTACSSSCHGAGRDAERGAPVARHGLVGSPEKTGRHTAKAQCLMIAGLAPGALVELDSVVLRGTYRVSRMELAGDTRGQEWGASLDLVSLAYYESRRLFR